MSAELFVHRSRDITACALYEDGVPTELFAVREEKKAAASGDILIGRVANTDASGTMTFVDIGEEKKAVLFSADRLPEARLSQGDSVLVQIKHEAAGTKGAMLTMHVSFAGKAVVLMPHENFVKLSKNIEDEGRRMRLKALGKVNILTRCKGYVAALRDSDVMIGHVPGLNIFHPSDIIFFKTLEKFDAVLHGNVTEMVDCKRNLVAHHASHLLDIIFQIIHSLFGDMNPRCIVRNGKDLIILAPHQRAVDRSRLMLDCF